jgi:TonB family protein
VHHQRRCWCGAAAVLAVVIALPAGRARAEAQRDWNRLPWIGSPRDSLYGEWTSNIDPAGRIRISTINDWIVIEAPGHGTAVGFGRTRDFLALVQPPRGPGFLSSSPTHPILRLRRVDTTTFEARWGDDLAGRLGAPERWSRLPPTPPMINGSYTRGPGEVYVDELPEAIRKVQPEYPTDLPNDFDETVIVKALVGRDGRVLDTQVVKSVPVLDDAAVASVKQWVFKPALSNNKPVAVWVAVPVRFSNKDR